MQKAIATLPEQPWTRLIAAVFIQAAQDAKGGDPILALDAALWLASPDAETFLEAVGFDADPLELLTSGKIRKVRSL